MLLSSSSVLGKIIALAILPTGTLAQVVFDQIAIGTVFGAGEYYGLFREASLNAQYKNEYNPNGFVFPNVTDYSNPPSTTTSSERLGVQLNYSIVDVENRNVSNLVYSLDFPEQSLPFANTTDWSLCFSVIGTTDFFPHNISSINGNGAEGDCTPYFGTECMEAYRNAFNRQPASYSDSCKLAPLLTQVPECRNQIGRFDHAMYSSSLNNFTDPELYYEYSNRTYYNSTDNNQPVENVTFHGLLRNQAFVSLTNTLGQGAVSEAQIRNQTAQLRFMVVSVQPGPKYYEALGNGGGQIPAPDYRMICGRASRNATGGDVPNAAVHGRGAVSSVAVALIAALTMVIALV